MRLGATQSTPSASPLVIAEVGGHYFTSEGGGGEERIVSVTSNELVWGGKHVILLDNSDGGLTNEDLRYKELKLTFSFIGEESGEIGRLFVFTQSYISYEGKLQVQLNCIDGWGLLSLAKTSFANWYFNQEWQKEANIDDYTLPSGDPIPADLRAELIANSERTIWDIIITLLDTIDRTYAVIPPWVPGNIDYDVAMCDRHPPISFANAISGVRQALEMTSSYLRWEGEGVFRQLIPENHPVCYSYDQDNSILRDVHEVGAVIPNQISFWAFNTDGDDWIYGVADDTDSQETLGTPSNPVIIPRHYILAPELQVDARSTEAELTDIAEGALDKIRQEREQGIVIAPMHCSQELFDKIEVKDSRYSPDKTITGIIHNILREYDRGVYRITMQLGGVGSGITQDFGGNVAVPLYEAEPPRAPIASGVWGMTIRVDNCLPIEAVAIGYVAAISDPGDALTQNPALTVPVPTAPSEVHAMTTVTVPSDVYVHDGVLLVDTDVTAENNDPLLTYPACPDTPSIGDGLYVCHTAKFDCVQFLLDTAGVGTYTFRVAYYNGSEWVAVPDFYGSGDETGDFKSGDYSWVSFERPVDWTLFTVDGKDRYIIKMEVDFEGTMTTTPLLNTATLGIW